jgi:stage III sporulation protein AG
VRWNEWLDRFRNGKGVKIAVALGIVGIVLLLISDSLPDKKAVSVTKAVKTVEEYREETEAGLKTLLEKMEGVGSCDVYVTFESGVEYVYATEQKENTDYAEEKNGEKISQREDSQESIILVDGNDGKEGLLLTEIQPKVKGVVVVCEGGGNAATAEKVTDAVTVALNVSARRVYVTK